MTELACIGLTQRGRQNPGLCSRQKESPWETDSAGLGCCTTRCGWGLSHSQAPNNWTGNRLTMRMGDMTTSHRRLRLGVWRKLAEERPCGLCATPERHRLSPLPTQTCPPSTCPSFCEMLMSPTATLLPDHNATASSPMTAVLTVTQKLCPLRMSLPLCLCPTAIPSGHFVCSIPANASCAFTTLTFPIQKQPNCVSSLRTLPRVLTKHVSADNGGG